TATINTVFLTLCYELYCIFGQQLIQENLLLFTSNNFLLFASNFLGIAASYYYDKSSRNEIMLRLGKEREKERLELKNTELEKQNLIISKQNTELLQQYEISSHFEILANQLKPHFLFNSLNTLSSLAQTDKKKSVAFIESFSHIYQYILQLRDEVIVPIEKEMDFVNAYYFMQNIRFDGQLVLDVHIDCSKQYYVPPFTLQLLVENAIKHNEISELHPLTVNIILDDKTNTITIKNKLRKINDNPQSTGVGLNNLNKRYELLTNKEIEINQTDNLFEVRVPAIIYT
ncbi:MAG: histidine kinase, partial [Bacteroidales bacterium]|nr:histidine kinase [Bacteroidales bacterium]